MNHQLTKILQRHIIYQCRHFHNNLCCSDFSFARIWLIWLPLTSKWYFWKKWLKSTSCHNLRGRNVTYLRNPNSSEQTLLVWFEQFFTHGVNMQVRYVSKRTTIIRKPNYSSHQISWLLYFSRLQQPHTVLQQLKQILEQQHV